MAGCVRVRAGGAAVLTPHPTSRAFGKVCLTAGLIALVAIAGVLAVRHLTTNPEAPLLPTDAAPPAAPPRPPPEIAEPTAFDRARRQMVDAQLRGRDITDSRVLEAMGSVPRHLFVSEGSRNAAYDDHPLPIGHEQTISQPYIVALMTQLAQPKPGHRALDVGTGSGYQAAVLSRLCKEVYGIEIVPPLAETARTRLAELGYTNVTVRAGDGYRGWPEHAPFDVIIVAAAPDHVPQALVDQLAPGGRLVIPVGGYTQHLTVIERRADGSIRRSIAVGVLFVPMTGEALKRRPPDGEP